jgi:hypothetical protein
MSGEIDVNLGELQAHGRDLTAVAGRIGKARGAGATVTGLSPQAFGLLCGFFSPPCVVMSQGALDSMDTLKGTVDGYAALVPAVGRIIQAADQSVGSAMDQVRSKLA